MEKLQDAKNTANQFAKKCRKHKYESIYDRFIRDKAFRKAQIEHGRTEQVILEMDKLANEDHSYKASKAEIEFYRGNWWLHSNVARVGPMLVRMNPGTLQFVMFAIIPSLLSLLTAHNAAGSGEIGVAKEEHREVSEQIDPGVQGQAQHCQICSRHVNPHAIHVGAWA